MNANQDQDEHQSQSLRQRFTSLSDLAVPMLALALTGPRAEAVEPGGNDPNRLQTVTAESSVQIDSLGIDAAFHFPRQSELDHRVPLIQQTILCEGIPVEGKKKVLFATFSKHVGSVSLSHLIAGEREALYVAFKSESDMADDTRMALPAGLAFDGIVPVVMFGQDNEVELELAPNADIKMSAKTVELKFEGHDLELMSAQLDVESVGREGSRVKQRFSFEPIKVWRDEDGKRVKLIQIACSREEEKLDGEKLRSSTRTRVKEYFSEDFEGLPGGPPIFASSR